MCRNKSHSHWCSRTVDAFTIHVDVANSVISAVHEQIAARKLLILFGFCTFGAFLVLDTFVFPITNLIREQVTAEVKVITKG